jgi:hypothetical protein
MITRENIESWAEAITSHEVSKIASNATDLLRNSQHKLSADVSFSEFSAAIIQLCDWIPTVSLGWSMDMRSHLSSDALAVFDRSTMAGEGAALGLLFQRANSDLRVLRDSKRWNNLGLNRLRESLECNIDLMPVESYKPFLENAASYGVKHHTDGTDKLDLQLFDSQEQVYEEERIILNQGLKAIINHGFKSGTSTEILEESVCLDECVQVAAILSRLAVAGVRMPVFQLDVLQVSQIMERLLIAYLDTDLDNQRTILSDGIVALTAITLREPGVAPTSRTNCFRPYYEATNWRRWMSPASLNILTTALDLYTKKMPEVEGNPAIADAIKILRMQLLVDGTLTAQTIGRQRTDKTHDLNMCAAIMGGFVRKLLVSCESYLMDKGALSGLDHKAKVVLIGLLPHGDTKLHLLKQNKAAKGYVLMDELGM